MKQYCSLLISLLLFVCFLFPNGGQAFAAELPESADFRAVWVSTVLNLDYPAAPTSDAGTLAQLADVILDGAAEMGFRAVILQVRPAADALYPSEIFPWSYYLTGESGQAPSDGFDPLAYWVEAAHARGLELHAWINPYRITKNTSEHLIESLGQLPHKQLFIQHQLHKVHHPCIFRGAPHNGKFHR